MRGRFIVAAVAAALMAPAAASAAVMPFNLSCTDKAGVRFCPGDGGAQRVKTFDGVPLDADVTLPPASAGDGPFPTIVMLHGWGGSKTSFEADGPAGNSTTNHQTYHYNNIWFAQQGYAVLNYSARGFGNSCGQPPSSRTPDCQQQVNNGGDQSAAGWIHLKDRRREAHDTQFLLGKLVDQGIADPNRLAATGISYGGGESIELAYLRNKTQLPNGRFVPWTTEKNTPLSLAAAWPRWPWSDLVSSLLPNGRFLDFDNSTADDSRNPIGIPIQSYIAGLYALGNTSGWIAPPGADPHADLSTWNSRVAAGEPTDDPETDQIASEIYNFHQGFGCSGCGAPAPLLIQNGWTDDLFPPAEALRVYNSVRAKNRHADVSLQFGDLGHARGQNKTPVDDYLNDQGTRFLGSRLRGAKGGPVAGSVTAFKQTCPSNAPAGAPISARSWVGIHPGAVRFSSAAAQQVASAGGNPQTGQTIDPIAGSGACATVPNAHDAGTAIYNGPKTGGYTLLGLPTVRAKVVLTGDYAQLDSRLWDVAPNGDRVLVSRGAYRLRSDQSGKTITFQLHGNGWFFASGHAPQLELLGRDAPYLRPSNSPFTIDVSKLTVELPTREKPGSRPLVRRPTISRPASTHKKRLKITVKPRRTRVGKRTRFTFRVRVGRRNIRGARVRFAGHRHRTGRKGRTRFVKRFHKRGPRTAVATKKGYRKGRVKVRVKPRKRHQRHQRPAARGARADLILAG